MERTKFLNKKGRLIMNKIITVFRGDGIGPELADRKSVV